MVICICCLCNTPHAGGFFAMIVLHLGGVVWTRSTWWKTLQWYQYAPDWMEARMLPPLTTAAMTLVQESAAAGRSCWYHIAVVRRLPVAANGCHCVKRCFISLSFLPSSNLSRSHTHSTIPFSLSLSRSLSLSLFL